MSNSSINPKPVPLPAKECINKRVQIIGLGPDWAHLNGLFGVAFKAHTVGSGLFVDVLLDKRPVGADAKLQYCFSPKNIKIVSALEPSDFVGKRVECVGLVGQSASLIGCTGIATGNGAIRDCITVSVTLDRQPPTVSSRYFIIRHINLSIIGSARAEDLIGRRVEIFDITVEVLKHLNGLVGTARKIFPENGTNFVEIDLEKAPVGKSSIARVNPGHVKIVPPKYAAPPTNPMPSNSSAAASSKGGSASDAPKAPSDKRKSGVQKHAKLKREDFYRHNQFTKFKKERKEIETERGFALKNLQKLQEEIANLDRQIDAKSKSMDEEAAKPRWETRNGASSSSAARKE